MHKNVHQAKSSSTSIHTDRFNGELGKISCTFVSKFSFTGWRNHLNWPDIVTVVCPWNDGSTNQSNGSAAIPLKEQADWLNRKLNTQAACQHIVSWSGVCVLSYDSPCPANAVYSHPCSHRPITKKSSISREAISACATPMIVFFYSTGNGKLGWGGGLGQLWTNFNRHQPAITPQLRGYSTLVPLPAHTTASPTAVSLSATVDVIPVVL